MSRVSVGPDPGVSAAAGRDAPATDATIAAVVFGDGPMLELNRRLTARLNPGRAVRWRIVRNLPLQAVDLTDDAGDPDVEVLEGKELPDELRALKKHRSYHHALALNVACRDVSTRYLILIDPDCYVLRRNWIEDVLTHMRGRGLAIFGAPYHPRSIAKLRYFPCSIFFVVDTTLVPVSVLDWYPEAEEPPRQTVARRVLQSTVGQTGWRLRLRYEESEDTGIRVYTHLRERGAAVECVQPVMIPDHLHTYFLRPKQRVMEKLLPDRYCVIPKRPGYITDRRFADLGYEDTAAKPIWAEEFMWRDAPFALHLRKSPESLRQDPEAISRLLAQFR
jgi:hypothetical protein